MGYNHPPGPPPGVGYNHPPGPPPGGWHQWRQGDHYSGNRVVVNNYSNYRLRPPPPGYQWVQDGSQFVLVAVASGIIADVILNAASQ
jgi:Ni/Co efflux regulator RcnB